MLNKRSKYDYRDIDWRELKLIRIGHAVWALYKGERALNGTYQEQEALLCACAEVWAIKKQFRLELAAERKASFKAWRP